MKKIDSQIDGIRFGLQSYIFSGLGLPPERALDLAIGAMAACGLGECDLYAPLAEPAGLREGGPEALAHWRSTVAIEHFCAIRRKFDQAGIAIHALSGFPGSDRSELAWTCAVARACGARFITLGAEVGIETARRIAPLAEAAEFEVALQGDPNLAPPGPAVIATPEDYARALGISHGFRLSFDIGDAVGGGYDVLPFLEAHHRRIALIYLKDRKRDGRSVPWGEGDTPIVEVLRLIRDRGWDIRCYIDCDHPTADRAADVRRSWEFVKRALKED